MQIRFNKDMTTNSKIVKHQIEILETLRKVVEVELPANKIKDARTIVMNRYHNGEIVLTADDHYDSEFHHIGLKE